MATKAKVATVHMYNDDKINSREHYFKSRPLARQYLGLY